MFVFLRFKSFIITKLANLPRGEKQIRVKNYRSGKYTKKIISNEL